MSSKEKAGFPIEENSDGSFSVNMEGNNVCVETHEEARWLSMLPVELNSIFTNTPENPNVENIKKIIAVCGEYNINSPAVRKLKIWLKKNTDQ